MGVEISGRGGHEFSYYNMEQIRRREIVILREYQETSLYTRTYTRSSINKFPVPPLFE